jgi:hypothetical protein
MKQKVNQSLDTKTSSGNFSGSQDVKNKIQSKIKSKGEIQQHSKGSMQGDNALAEALARAKLNRN